MPNSNYSKNHYSQELSSDCSIENTAVANMNASVAINTSNVSDICKSDDKEKLIISSTNNRKFIIIPSKSTDYKPIQKFPPSISDSKNEIKSVTPSTAITTTIPTLIIPKIITTTPTTISSSSLNDPNSVDNLSVTITPSEINKNNEVISRSNVINYNNNNKNDISTLTTASLFSTAGIPDNNSQISNTTINSDVKNSSTAIAVNLRPKLHNSVRSVVSAHLPSNYECTSPSNSLTSPASLRIKRTSSYVFGSNNDQSSKIYSDANSIRSLASIGVGSTDGRKLIIKRVPNSPTELFNIVSPLASSPPRYQKSYEDDDDDDSYENSSVDTRTTNLKPRRQHWSNKLQFVLACIAYSVGLGNVWRFPYLCYKSGGGVFLIPYFIILIICGAPMLFMELSIGQYTGRGPIAALGQLCPLFKGAGLASVVVSFLMSTYYSVIIAYAIYYLFTSFKPIMPWTDCNNRWNTPDCWVPQRKDVNMTPPDMSRTPSEEFFENKVLQISRGIEYPGYMRWELFACLIFAWLLVYFATWKSIKSSAKVRYFTATFPFVLIIVFMGRALTLEGADEGLRYFFYPRWELLKNANVWINAASQNFNSLGISFGSMISFASYNKYNNNIMYDTIAVSVINAITSILVGIFAFATLGNLALEQNTNVEDVIGDGPGLIFVVYPQAMSKMPAGRMWAVMFFFMLLCLGLNSQFAIVEVVVTSIQDGFPNWIKRKLICHELLVLIICVISLLLGLPNLLQSGIYFFQLIDHYAASISIMFLAFFQMIAIAWFYGVDRLGKNVKQMTAKAPSLYLRSCWMLCGPLLLISLWIFSLINYHEPTFHNGKYIYPNWAYGLGWAIASMSLVCIPAYAAINFIRSEGNNFCDKLKNSVKPNIYECKICGEHHCEHDFPDEQYILAQEMTPIIPPKIILKSPPIGHMDQAQSSLSTATQPNTTTTNIKLKDGDEKDEKNVNE